MSLFKAILYENVIIQNFSINSLEKKQYFLLKRTGKLERSYDKSWMSKAEELKLKDLPKNYKEEFKNKQIPQLHTQRLVQEYGELIEFLKKQNLREWEISFRNFLLNRIIQQPSKENRNEFNHYSIRIKFKHKNITRAIELGEGHTHEEIKFNQKGLIQRIKNIISNNVNKEPLKYIRTSIILSSGNGGIFLHEILGHSLEADYIYHRSSPFTKEHLGKKILSDKITITTRDKKDDFFKNYSFDDEGERPDDDILIKKGLLKHLISDYFHKRLLNLDSSGFCRVDSFENIPTPRMFALYLKPGNNSPEELIQSTSDGILAKEFGRGHVDFNKKLFFFNINEAYLIKKGKINMPLGNITVSGNLLEVLNSIEMIGNDFRYDSGINYCNKNGQILNVRLGQPSIKINNILAGRFENA